ncbi:gonadal somatic cell derived factor isoform X1, partial [Clarias magur]
MLCSVFALVLAQDGTWDCSDEDGILREARADVSVPSACTLDCTYRTYRAVLELQRKMTIRFTDARA